LKNVIVIPARLESKRFPNKISYKLFGISMIEHVRRRCLLAKNIDEVYVATPNIEIKKEVESFGGKVIMTSIYHENGTSRVAEAIQKIKCKKVILVQGDEPLILPNQIDHICKEIDNSNNKYAWNGVSPILDEADLKDQTVVKCSIVNDKINFCFRKSPSIAKINDQLKIFKKVMGIIAFEKSFLIDFSLKEKTQLESLESIEQLRIIEHGYDLTPIKFKKNFPSVNLIEDIALVLNFLKHDIEQKNILREISKINGISK